jgi:hypothetical protein
MSEAHADYLTQRISHVQQDEVIFVLGSLRKLEAVEVGEWNANVLSLSTSVWTHSNIA